MTLAYDWPASIEPKSRKVGNDYHRYYPIPEVGDCVGVTSFLKVVGTGTNSLMAWAAGIERDAAIEAAVSQAREGLPMTPEAILERLGPARRHVVATQKQADIGSEVHGRIKWDMCGLTGQKRVLGEPRLTTPAATLAYSSFTDWWDQAGLKAVRSEQTVWHRGLLYAGTTDEFAEDPSLGLGILDFKSSKYVYDTHHMQLAGYMAAAVDMGIPVGWGKLIHLPKNADQAVKVVELGDLWDRQLTYAELWSMTQAALRLWRGLCEKPED